MKKSLIALSLAALPVAAMADVTLYGQIKAGVQVSQLKVGGEKSKTATEIVDLGSRIGFKGHEHLGSNLNAIWQVENTVSVGGNGQGTSGGKWADRDSYIGLEGGFGKIRAGRISTPVKDMDALDAWEYGSNALGLGVFTRNDSREVSVRYDTPVFSGFSASVQYTPRDNANPGDKYTHDEPSRDAYFGGLNYENSGFFAQYGVGFKKNAYNNNNGDGENGQVHRVFAGYDANNLFAGLGYQYTKGLDTLGSYASAFADAEYTPIPNDPTIKTQEVAATAAYRFGNVTPRITYAHGFKAKTTGGDKIGDSKYDQVVVGADYDFSKRTSAMISAGWLKFGKGENKIQNTAGMVGLRHLF
ncbi:trimeric porin PorB [Neisseria montereyensis]|uniref:Trimeric porin PorB n=1 Tax=Neisseria montereyensis TaxID=2973938 RepID=A0ABT2FE25_9NEIS|nr:trimeric porin PorB [Neisseria montereyensis]MCS4534200.1 trimeric porin PorB [Neisseria montereyensis]